ncbi:LpxI family protein [Roseicyclus marinus]|uniref:LpxI family protein n=1 Tax=Roseicyclus marinus TaxID=2161673 RepID=UPI00240EF056|nr:UDP-2,3-diacylglucosamine diphosphatase LpxI [Roseicyclus marinus]MDG3040141.1 UDP-2,3-diacylglucosamine diphosphatase LpxI [Roseicyclus marinus]
MGARAIIAGDGALPGLVAAAGPALIVRLEGMPGGTGGADVVARLERLGTLFADLHRSGVTEVCFAGAMRRVGFDPAALDAETRALLPRLTAAMGQGDDALLRDIVAIFEEQGFTIRGAHELRPDLAAPEGAIAGTPRPEGDAARARAVLAALGPLDVGQAAVAAGGQMLGIETLQGTDAMLRFVAKTAPGSGGVLVKRAKPGQDLRVDMPVIGPDTVTLAASAGLSGIEIEAARVLLLDPEAVLAACAARGVALWAVP